MQPPLVQIPMILLADLHVEPDKREELNNEQDSAGRNSSAIANASLANVESSSEESPLVDRKDISRNGDNSPMSGGNIFRSNVT